MPQPFSIPILDLGPEIDTRWDELTDAFHRVLRSGRFIGGPEVVAFEREAAGYLGAAHAVGVNSGTDALVIALRALGVGPGDEVVTTPFSFFATAESISAVGAAPVFADIDERTFNLDPDRIEPLLTERTKAILPVHLYGRPAAMDRITAIAEQHGLRVVEDCAQSFGARSDGRMTGTIGAVGAFSFFPSKTLGALGDAGLLTTDDDAVAAHARKLRAHGAERKYHNEEVGYNSRLDALQAAFLRVKLPHVEANNTGRRRVAEMYGRLLEGVEGVVAPEVVPGHVFHQYTVRVLDGRRDAVAEALAERGIQTMVYYPVPQDRLPVYAALPNRCPVSDRLAGEVLSLPIWPQMEEDVQRQVVEALRVALRDSVKTAGSARF